MAEGITSPGERGFPGTNPESVFGAIAETASIAIFISRGEHFEYVNRAMEELTGYPREALQSMRVWEVVHPNFQEVVRRQARLRERGKSVPNRYEVAIVRNDGEVRWVDLTVGKIEWRKEPAVIGMAVDITRHRKAEEILRKREAHLREIAENIEEVVFLASPDLSRVLYVNPAYERVFGRPPSHLREGFENWVESVHPEDGAHAFPDPPVREPFTAEYRILRPDGEMRWIQMHLNPVKRLDGKVIRVVGVARDVTLLRQAEETILQVTMYDPVTGLSNRFHFMEFLWQKLEEADQIGVILVNIRGIQEMKVAHGHNVVDGMLQEVGRRLENTAESGEFVARMETDTLAVVVPGDARKAAQRAVHIRNLIEQQPFRDGATELALKVYVGIAVYPEDGSDPEELLRKAEQAVEYARKSGQDVAFYRKDMENLLRWRMEILRKIRNALDDERWTVHIQPIVSLKTGQLVGGEALLRLADPDGGLLYPEAFLSVVLEQGWGTGMTLGVMREVARWLRRWKESGLGIPGPIAINVAPGNLMDPTLLDGFSAVADEEGVEPSWFGVEITEEAVEHPAQATQVLQALKAMGVTLLLDDFGTGYSSLAHLKTFPVDRIKVDREFVQGMMENPDDRAIVSGAIALAHALGLEVVAEGVETKEQVEALKTLGCEYIQGYYIGKPVPPEEFEARWLKALSGGAAPG